MKASQFGKGPEIVTPKDLAAWLLFEDAVYVGDDLVYACQSVVYDAAPLFWRAVLTKPVYQALYKVEGKP